MKIGFERLFNMGNYQNMKVSLETEAEEKDLDKEFEKLVRKALELRDHAGKTEEEYKVEKWKREELKRTQDELERARQRVKELEEKRAE